MRKRFGRHLRVAVSASAAPYGYTLTIWTSGAVTIHALGTPNVWRALLFVAGAVLGFAAVAAVAHGSPDQTFADRDLQAIRVWGGFHIVSVGGAVVAAALLAGWPGGIVAWLLIGCAATVIYLLGVAAQFTAAESVGAADAGRD